MDAGVHTLIYIFIFASAFMGMQLVLGMGKQAARTVQAANHRMKQLEAGGDNFTVLAKLRKDRGIDETGNYHKKALYFINQMVVHSGLRLQKNGIFIIIAAVMIVSALAFFLWKGTIGALIIGLIIGLITPFLILKSLIKRRRNKAVTQLPEALDVIVRSLSAGHPVTVAMAMVAKEMPDPIGTEFGIASDEIAFGSTLSVAIQRLSERVGHEDFALFSAMIRLQERTGGNLAFLLSGNSKTIRERQKMRLKVKAASAEGRMSAIILNLAPLGLFLLIKVVAPDFYGEVEDSKVVTYSLWGALGWMIIGNSCMYKMINFKI